MPQVPPVERTKKRRDKLLSLGLVEKNVWVPAALAAALAAYALYLRRQAGLLLPTDPPFEDEVYQIHAQHFASAASPVVTQRQETAASHEPDE